MRRTLLVVSVVGVAALAALLAISIAGNELAKDARPGDDGTLTATNGDVVRTATVQFQGDLLGLVNEDGDVLDEINTVSFDADLGGEYSSEVYLKVAMMVHDGTTLTIHGTNGAYVTLTQTTALFTTSDGVEHDIVLSMGSAGRRLRTTDGNGPRPSNGRPQKAPTGGGGKPPKDGAGEPPKPCREPSSPPA